MKIRRIGNVQYWYDGNAGVRCWWAAEFDAEGNQVGDAVDAYTKDEIVQIAKEWSA